MPDVTLAKGQRWEPTLAAASVEGRTVLDIKRGYGLDVIYCPRGCFCPQQKAVLVSTFKRWIRRTNARLVAPLVPSEADHA